MINSSHAEENQNFVNEIKKAMQNYDSTIN